MKKLLFVLGVVAAMVSCNQKIEGPALLPAENFDQVVDGKQVALYTIKGGDVIAQITNFGARIITLWTPDRNGVLGDVSVGYENLDRYINNDGERFLGAVVGPVANRIGGATFQIDGETFNTPQNNNGNTLHSGFKGVDMEVWDVVEATDNSLKLHYVHPDGKEGFPGNLDITVTYTITDDSALRVDYLATTDKATPVNLSQHCFFNLACDGRQIVDHQIQINASATTPVDSLLIPSGEIDSVEGTPMDLRKMQPIGAHIDDDFAQLSYGGGYDHNWCLDKSAPGALETAAIVYEPATGRKLEVITDQPGIQFYAGNAFTGGTLDKWGNETAYRTSIALETQKFPDSVNHENFPNSVLRPGETYTQVCIYKFSAE